MKLLKEHIQLLINETINDVLLEQKGGSIIDALQKASNDFIDFSENEQEIPTKEEIVKQVKKFMVYKKQADDKGNFVEKQYWEKEIKDLLKYNELYNQYQNEDDIPVNLYHALEKVAMAYGLKEISHGSSRTAYELPIGAYVLKIARNKKGIAQNEHEVEVYTNPQIKDIVPRIYPKSDLQNYSYLIVEKVNAFSTYNDFKKIKQYSSSIIDFVALRPNTWFSDLQKALVTAVNVKNKPERDFTIDYICSQEFSTKYISQYNSLRIYDMATIKDCCLAFKDKKWIDEVANLIIEGSLAYNDVYAEHFGTTSSGRVVIFDTGLSEEIYGKHYKIW